MKWVCFPKFYSPLANWPWLRISPQSSLNVTYCLIRTAWQWLMSFTCIPVQTEPNKSSLRNRLLALLLWETGYLSSPSRSCLGRLILTHGGRLVGGSSVAEPPYRKRGRETIISCLLEVLWLGTEFATQAGVLTRNWTGDHALCRMASTSWLTWVRAWLPGF